MRARSSAPKGGPPNTTQAGGGTTKRPVYILLLLLVVGVVVFLLSSTSVLSGGFESPREKASSGRREVEVRGTAYSMLREYRMLQQDLRNIQLGMGVLRHALHNEPHPPKSDPFTVRAPLNASEKARLRRLGESEGDIGNAPHDYRLDETIFVSVASFRDWECPNTVRDMYSKSRNPARLFLGIIQQNEIGDPSCIPDEYFFPNCSMNRGFCPADNIRMRKVFPHEAKGPTFGRWVAMLMYRDEKYFMMIDSHNRFSTHWDHKLITMYQLIPSKKGVLSHYPNSWLNSSTPQESEGSLMVMCYAHFLDLGYVRLGARVMPKSARPRLQPYAAAGFLFADGALVREVPFDPYLDFIFDGEEILYSVRMWTHGWDLYSPTESVLFHYYLRSGAPRVWSVKQLNWSPVQAQSQRRVQYILGATYPNTTNRLVPLDTKEERVKRELDVYGLGKERSLDDYWRFARIDPIHRKTDYSFCDNIPNKER